MSPTIRGYTDRPNAAPGEMLTVHVSAQQPGTYNAGLVRLVHLDPSAAGPGMKVEPVPGAMTHHCPGRHQRTQVGSYVAVRAHRDLTPRDGLTVHAFVQPTLPKTRRQAIVSAWDEDRHCGWALWLEDGGLSFQISDEQGRTARISCEKPVFDGCWYSVTATHDAGRGTIAIAQSPVVTSAGGLFGPVVPLDSADARQIDCGAIRPGPPRVPLIIGGAAESSNGDRTWVTACFDGKIDSPRLYARPLRDEEVAGLSRGEEPAADGLVARWDFAEGTTVTGIATDTVVDRSGHGHDGICINQPERAVTGWNWTGRTDVFTAAPEQYGAVCLHADALDDCRWDSDFTFRVPGDLGSGCYALHVVQGDAEDHIPFFVRRAPNRPAAPIAVLMPTLSYVVYGNYHNIYPWEGWGFDPYEAINSVIPLEERDVEMRDNPDDYGRSPYDHHADGRGVQYASWRRPILDVRPGQEFSFNYQADFYLIDWLEAESLDYDVITDHDLHRDGVDLLRPYNVVVTGSHPEYYTWEMLDAVEEYLADGGRGMYLGGNGFYWVTALHPDKPWLAEVRRGDTGDGPWHARPGEYHHAFTGERGGLWRHRGRAPQKIWGTGYVAHTLGVSGYYVRMPDSHDNRVAWMFEGIGADERIGDFGLVGGGAAGIELDAYDRALGTPPHTLLLASSVEHDQSAMLVPEELNNIHPAIVADEHPKIRADITYFTTANGGGVFATSAIGWSGGLSENSYDNSVARLTGNVLRRFASDEPLPPVVGSPA